MYSHSLNPNYGYHFAIVSINVTSWTYKFLIEGDLKNHFYNTSNFIDTDRMRLEHFLRIFSNDKILHSILRILNYLNLFLKPLLVIFFVEFNEYWLFRKTNIMQFEQETKQFCLQLKLRLRNEASIRIEEKCLDDKEFLRTMIVSDKNNA